MVKFVILGLAALATLAVAGPSGNCKCVKIGGGEIIQEAHKKCCTEVGSNASDNECEFDPVQSVLFSGCCAGAGGFASCHDQ